MGSRILIIADDLAERSLIARALHSGGHSVELAESAKRALKLAANQRFAAAVVAMTAQPIGEAIIRELQGAVSKVIAVVDQRKEGGRPDRVLFPADALLSRPIGQAELLARILELKGPSDQPSANEAPLAFSFEGCTFDVAGRTFVDRTGRQTPLTRSEAELLATFVRSPKRVLTRDQLRRAIAGRGVEAFDQSVDILVARLRHKIEPEPRAPRFIQTMSGSGYKFNALPHSVEPDWPAGGAMGDMKHEAAFFDPPSNTWPGLTIPPVVDAPGFRPKNGK